MTARAPVIYIIAGEPSGDFLGAQLMRALLARDPGMTFHGIGGRRMEALGLASLFPYHELSLMGFVEVLPHALQLIGRVNFAVEDILSKQPDMVITIDSPGFNFRVVEKLRQENLRAKFVHYVAPTVWAYKPERAERCSLLFDHLLALLPFEPPYFEKAGLKCSFVGHPVVVETAPGNGKAFREKYQIADSTTLFCLLPGSRKSEIDRHMPIFARSLILLSSHYTDLAIAVAVPKHVFPMIAPYFQACPFRAVVTADDEDKKNAIAAGNLAITKSGTIALEVAAAGSPMIVSYRVNPISAWILKRQATTKYVNLINILQKDEVVPELLQELCSPATIAAAAFQLLESPARQQQQKDAFRSALSQLRHPTGAPPSEISASIVMKLLHS